MVATYIYAAYVQLYTTLQYTNWSSPSSLAIAITAPIRNAQCACTRIATNMHMFDQYAHKPLPLTVISTCFYMPDYKRMLLCSRLHGTHGYTCILRPILDPCATASSFSRTCLFAPLPTRANDAYMDRLNGCIGT